MSPVQLVRRVASVAACAFLSLAAAAAERTVYPTEQGGLTGPQQLTNALAQAESGDVIVVKSGTYDLSDVWMSTETLGKGVGTNHLAVSVACEIRGETTGHWNDAVIFTGRWRALRIAADVAVKTSGITFDGFTGGTWTGNDTASSDCAGAGVRFYAQYEEGNANHGRGCCISNCVIRNCSSDHGAAVLAGLAVDCLIEKNTGKVAPIGFRTRVEGCLLRGNRASAYYGLQDSVGIYDSVFTNNYGAGYGGAVCFHGQTYQGASPCVISNCQFLANETGSDTGAGIGLEGISTANAPKVMDCIFRANKMTGANGGSAIGCSGNGNHFRMTVDRSTFADHRTSDCPVIRGRDAQSVFILNDCLFTNNYASADGCGIGYASVWATNCVFVANEADGGNEGGAAYIRDDGTGFFKDCTFRSDVSYYGGALYYEKKALGGAEDCVFEDCNGRYRGGAVCCLSADSNLFVRCTYRNGLCSKADGQDLGGAGAYGGIHSNCIFTANSCKMATALAAGVAIDCALTNNPSMNHSFGAAIKSRLVRCDINNGGIWFCSLDRCRVHDVSSAFPYCVFYGANWATNCLITKCCGTWGNWYRGTDSYSYLPEEGPSTVGEYVNCTFADNCHDTGYQMICYDGSKTYSNRFENCILYGNHRDKSFTGASDDFSLYKKSSGGIAVGVVTNCLIGTKGSIAEPARQYIDLGGVKLGTDPLFAKEARPAQLEYYAIIRKSPARDVVEPAPWMATATDLVGSNRVFGAKCDLGCYEYSLGTLGLVMVLQ